MKKILSFLLVLTISLTLFGCTKEVKEYTVTLELNGGLGNSSYTLEEGKDLTVPLPTKEGYSFGGWYEEDSLTTIYEFSTMPSKDFTIYAKWEINTYTITWVLNEDIEPSSVEVDFGHEISEPMPTKEGYTFTGWYTDNELNNQNGYTSMPSMDITLYAKWSINTYTTTLELNGGTGDSSISEEYGTAINEPIPTKEGYTFAGWYIDSTFTTKYIFNTMPAEDFTLYAKWIIDAETITLNLNGGIGETSIVEVSGVTISAPADPTRTGYTFAGWYSDSALTNTYLFETMPSNDITVYAKWDFIEYSFSVIANITEAIPTMVKGSIVNDKQTYTVTAPGVEGFNFKHWRVEGTNTVLSVESVYIYSLSENTVLEAVYEEKGAVVEPTLAYETSFEDGDKGSYAIADIVLSGETWTFDNALIGSLATDLSVSGKSARFKDGFIATKFAISDLAQVIFYLGTYGNDDDNLVEFKISVDGTNWVIVDSFTSTGTLVEYNYIFDDTMFSNLSLNASDSYYFMISSSSSERVNIDDFKIYTGEGSIIDDTPLYTISFTDDMVYAYQIDDVVDLDECVATHPTSGTTTCDITGSVDTSVAGSYEVTYSKTDEFGNTAIETVNITVIDDNYTALLAMDLMQYYDDAEGLFGIELMEALHLIINDGFSGVTYGDVRYILDETDEDPSNPSNLILIYLGTSINDAWDGGDTWNREHVWPQSLLGEEADNGTVNSASDLYNLMPADPGLNSSRGNSPYSEMGLGFEPRDEVKGDVARALFYMMIMYEELDLVNSSPGIHEMAYLDELLKWHFEDPVDDFELARMDVIFSYQYNRNPFVDYPHLVSLIWFYVNAEE